MFTLMLATRKTNHDNCIVLHYQHIVSTMTASDSTNEMLQQYCGRQYEINCTKDESYIHGLDTDQLCRVKGSQLESHCFQNNNGSYECFLYVANKDNSLSPMGNVDVINICINTVK